MRLSLALSFKAHVALRTGDIRSAEALSGVSYGNSRVHIGQRAYDLYQRAEALIRDGDRHRAVRLLSEADQLVENLPPAEELPSSIYWYTKPFFLGRRGFVLRAMGDMHGARTAAREAIAAMPPKHRESEWAGTFRQLADD